MSQAATSTSRQSGSDSGAYRRDKPIILVWLVVSLLTAVSAIGVWLWQRQVATSDEHEKRIGAIERSGAAVDERLRGIDKAVDETRSDVKELLRRSSK